MVFQFQECPVTIGGPLKRVRVLPFNCSYKGLAPKPKLAIHIQQNPTIPRNPQSCFLILEGAIWQANSFFSLDSALCVAEISAFLCTDAEQKYRGRDFGGRERWLYFSARKKGRHSRLAPQELCPPVLGNCRGSYRWNQRLE